MFNYCEQKEGENGGGEEKQRQRENGNEWSFIQKKAQEGDMNHPFPL